MHSGPVTNLLNTKYTTPDAKANAGWVNCVDSGLSGLWTMDYGLWSMDYGLWTLYGRWLGGCLARTSGIQVGGKLDNPEHEQTAKLPAKWKVSLNFHRKIFFSIFHSIFFLGK